jgi:branched-chain amino acid transport system ATP-binding protein
MTALLSLRGIHAGYQGIEVLRAVDLDVPSGAVVALLGPNGAGKTTALRVVSGSVVPTAGCVHLAGEHVNGARPELLARAGLCTIPGGRGVFPHLTVQEHLEMATHAGAGDLARVEEIAFGRFPRLGERRHQAAGTLSGGEQQMLALARGLAVDPSVLVVDELSMGLAPRIVHELYAAVADIARAGVAVLVVEQFAHAVLEVADCAVVLRQGRVVAVGEPVDVAAELSDLYLASG